MRHREWSIRFSSPSLGPFPLPLPRNMLVHIVEIVQVCPMCTYLTDLLYLKKPGPSIKWKKKKNQSLGQITRKNYAKTFDKELPAQIVMERYNFGANLSPVHFPVTHCVNWWCLLPSSFHTQRCSSLQGVTHKCLPWWSGKFNEDNLFTKQTS